MAVLQIEITSRAPYEGGVSFGDAGAYERLDGILRFAVDPAAAANQAIVDLDRAERDGAGKVHFSADLCLLRPVDTARANHSLLLDVVNRGRKSAPGSFNRAPRLPVPTERIDPGDGFLMRRSWTVAWCGWQWDVFRTPALMGLEAPRAGAGVPGASDGDGPIEGDVLVQFQPNARERDHGLADRVHRPYPAADVDDPRATLTVRDRIDGPRTPIARGRWRFARDEAGRPAADDGSIWLEGGFEAGRIYEAVYRTRTCPVAGVGLLAVRDAVSFLRYAGAEAENPCAGTIEHTFGYGASQSGRFLRSFLHLGLNLDEMGRQVFDGLLPNIAGAHRGEFNHRFAQPSVQAARGFGQLPPFADDPQTDPVTGEVGGLLDRQRATGGVPRIIYTNTAAEYWSGDVSRGDASLAHTDLAGTHDVDPPPEARIYYFAGTQHVSGALPLTSINPLDGARAMHTFNVIDFSPLVRAALVNLERWVVAGDEPPPSSVPRLADGTAVPLPVVLETFRGIPGAGVPDPEALPASLRLDLGPEADRGVARYPAQTGEPYPAYVAAVDADGNEVAGIRLPAIAVPAATYTGWNPRHPETGGAGQIVMMLGSTLPFAATRNGRLRTGDPRPSIEERYRDRNDYLDRARAAAQALVQQGYLLPEDGELTAQQALQRYLAFVELQQDAAAPGA